MFYIRVRIWNHTPIYIDLALYFHRDPPLSLLCSIFMLVYETTSKILFCLFVPVNYCALPPLFLLCFKFMLVYETISKISLKFYIHVGIWNHFQNCVSLFLSIIVLLLLYFFYVLNSCWCMKPFLKFCLCVPLNYCDYVFFLHCCVSMVVLIVCVKLIGIGGELDLQLQVGPIWTSPVYEKRRWVVTKRYQKFLFI